jgi:hypothetical protein
MTAQSEKWPNARGTFEIERRHCVCARESRFLQHIHTECIQTYPLYGIARCCSPKYPGLIRRLENRTGSGKIFLSLKRGEEENAVTCKNQTTLRLDQLRILPSTTLPMGKLTLPLSDEHSIGVGESLHSTNHSLPGTSFYGAPPESKTSDWTKAGMWK